ncbi:MAG TPA: transporter [Casimicrobiaceae bacterium]|nr:transporter [Casimicrobiaceae bacterium]
MKMGKATVKTSRKQDLIAAALFAALAFASADVCAQQTDEELALAALNPIAAMVSVPLQYNYDHEIGPQEAGHKNYVNVQPVIPFSLNEDWNLISRTIVPVVWQQDIFPGAGSQSGIGDTTQSFFFSPKKPTADGWIWGVGPVLYLPTASQDLLGADKWGLGPTGVVLKQEHGWTYGALVNHIWSTGGAGRATVNNTFMQPFLEYTNKSLTSFILQTETTYDWTRNQWSVPVHFLVSQFFKVGEQKMTFQVGARYWAVSPDAGAHGWGLRATLTLLFPAK